MSPKGTPRIGAPRSLHEIEQDRIEADLEAREQELDDAAMSQPLDLTPEERAAAEQEKARLLEELKASRPAKPGPERSAPESLSSHPIVDISEVAPEREVEVVEPSRLDAVEQAESELLALAQDEAASLDEELRVYEEKSALETARLREAGEQKRAEIRRRQEEQRALIAKERAAALPSQLAEKAKVATQQAQQNRERASGRFEEQRKTLRDQCPIPDDRRTFGQIFDTATRVLKEVTALNRQHGPALREMAALAAFIDTPGTWPVELRQKMGAQVIMPARELVKVIDQCSSDRPDSPVNNLKYGEAYLRTGANHSRDNVPTLALMLSHTNDDLVRYIHEQITLINDRFEMILAQGRAYVASGEVPPEVVVMLSEGARQEMKERHLTKHLRDPRQSYAAGMGEPMPSE
jgi:hypothetical protein